MKRLAVTSGLVALLGIAALSGPGAEAQDRGASIKRVMVRMHHKQRGLVPNIAASLRSGSPDWAAIKKESKEVVDLSGSIAEMKPPKGNRANYQKLSMAFLADAQQLKDAADAEDASKAGAAIQAMSGTCKTCHQAHKGR